MKIEIDLNIPKGYEATGEYRIPRTGEWYLWRNGVEYKARHEDTNSSPYIILRRKFKQVFKFVEDPDGKYAVNICSNGTEVLRAPLMFKGQRFRMEVCEE